MTPRRVPPWAVALVLVALVAGFVGIEVWRDRRYGEPKPGDAVLYVRSGPAMRRLALSYSALLSDVYWVRAVQYFGGTRLSKSSTKSYVLLYPLLDIATSLDPRFNIAYRFGAIFLSEAYPGGAGRPDQAIALLEKGFRENPRKWQYLQDIGFVHYWWLGDYHAAAAWFEKAADVPGAPWWLQSLAATTKVKGGDRIGSRALWQSLRETADNEWVRNNAVLRLAQLDALDAIDALTVVVRGFASRTGTLPASWQVLVAARLLPGLPVDPTGVPYRLDARTGVVALSPESTLNPLPAGPGAERPMR